MSKTSRNRQDSSNDKGRAKVLPRGLPSGSKEADLLRNVKKILDIFKAQEKLSYRRIHVQPVLRSGQFSKNSEMAGLEDLQVYLHGGKTLFLELKSMKGKQSPAQRVRQDELLWLGHSYYVVRCVEDLAECLRLHGLSILVKPG